MCLAGHFTSHALPLFYHIKFIFASTLLILSVDDDDDDNNDDDNYCD